MLLCTWAFTFIWCYIYFKMVGIAYYEFSSCCGLPNRTSLLFMMPKGIRHIVSTVTTSESSWSWLIFHLLESKSISSATIAFSLWSSLGFSLSRTLFRGNHLSFQILIWLPYPTRHCKPSTRRSRADHVLLQTYDGRLPSLASRNEPC